MRGGARKGTGPKRGSKNIRTKKREAAVAEARRLSEKILGKKAFQGNALMFMQTIYRNPEAPMEMRQDAARCAMPYETARKNEHTWDGDGPAIRIESLNITQLETVLAKIETAIAGLEGQSQS